MMIERKTRMNDLTKIWNGVIAIFAEKGIPNSDAVSLAYVCPKKINGTCNCIYFRTPNESIKELIEEKYKAQIEKYINFIVGERYDAVFFVEEDEAFEDASLVRRFGKMKKVFEQAHDEMYESVKGFINDSNAQENAEEFMKSEPINPECTFEAFEDKKQRAYSAILEVLSAAKRPVPIFIYGKNRSDKTYLLHASANYIKCSNPEEEVLFVTAAKFIKDYYDFFSENCASKQMMFKKKYRDVDALIVDDFEKLINDDVVITEFFHTYNALYGSGKQIIIGCEKHLSEYDQLDDWYKKRFTNGECIRIDED